MLPHTQMSTKVNATKYLYDEKNIDKNKKWQREKKGQTIGNEYNITLQTFIRNKIHHPENKTMKSQNYSTEELKKSIDEMINILKSYDQTN